MQNDKENCTRFGCWIRDNTSIVLMFLLVIVFLGFALHIAHSQDVDTETLRWSRDKAGEVLIALVALLQGTRAIASKSNHSPTGDDNSVTVVTPAALPADPEVK